MCTDRLYNHVSRRAHARCVSLDKILNFVFEFDVFLSPLVARALSSARLHMESGRALDALSLRRLGDKKGN